MQTAIETFKLNIRGAKQLHLIFEYLEISQVKTLDLSEILRSEIVLAISALDSFISDVLYLGIVEVFEGRRSISFENLKPFNEFPLSMQTLIDILNTADIGDRSILLGNYVIKCNSKNPYQDPKQIENALLVLGVKQLWTKLSPELSMPAEDIKKELANIVWQRHKIAHEADFDQITQSKRVRDGDSTREAVEFIEKLASGIYNLVK